MIRLITKEDLDVNIDGNVEFVIVYDTYPEDSENRFLNTWELVGRSSHDGEYKFADINEGRNTQFLPLGILIGELIPHSNRVIQLVPKHLLTDEDMFELKLRGNNPLVNDNG